MPFNNTGQDCANKNSGFQHVAVKYLVVIATKVLFFYRVNH